MCGLKLRLLLLVLLGTLFSGPVSAEIIRLFADGFGDPDYAMSGIATGLSGQTVTLLSVGVESIAVTQDGPFAFALRLPNGHRYALEAQSTDQKTVCSVVPDSGQVAGTDITNLTLSCATAATWDHFAWDQADWN